jgi:GTP cyclohydrolase I
MAGGRAEWNTVSFLAIVRWRGVPVMSDVTAIDSEKLDREDAAPANGDNSIPRGDDQRIIEAVAGHVAAIMSELKLDLDDPNYEQTPERVAKMYLEMFHGLREGAEPKITTFPNDEDYHHMVIEREIPFYSMCAHHFVPFYGHAHIAYIPEAEVVGLSKLPRILEFYAKRPQLQERLTEQVAEFLWTNLEPQGVMVVIEARHLCVEMRGVKKAGALTTTSALRGCFADRLVREEFLALLRRQAAW